MFNYTTFAPVTLDNNNSSSNGGGGGSLAAPEINGDWQRTAELISPMIKRPKM